MELTGLLALCLGLCLTGPALRRQTPDDDIPPGISILSYKWVDATSGLQADPSNRASEHIRGGGSGPIDTSAAPSTAREGERKKTYVYSMEIRNGGSRVIEAVAWDYVFNDPVTKTEMRRHSFGSFEKIGIDVVKTLRIRSVSAPSLVVDAAVASKKLRPFDERVVINCALYADGTAWEPPEAKGTGCESLREELTRRKKPKP